MALYLDTRGNSSCAVGICARCQFKVAYSDLSADRDKPGMRVCDKCNDMIDAWRLTPRATEDVTLQYPRPDVDITNF